MKILEYSCRDIEEPGWNFARVKFGRINLLVGNTATGKTRLLNTIFNLGSFAASKKFHAGNWDIVFEHAGTKYTWNLETEKQQGGSGTIVKDDLWKHEGETLIPIIQRDKENFSFLGKPMPKLSLQETSVSLLREEEAIKPLREAFSSIMRRRFFDDALSKISELHAVPAKIIENMEHGSDLRKLFATDMNLSANLFILRKYFRDIYDQIITQYRRFFPFIEEAQITDLTKLQPDIALAGNIPVFAVREHNSDKWIPITELSSGMQKVLLILTDIFIIPESGVYLIDEYENSLGINAIDFFPEFVLELEKDIQFFMTSHHPYIINAIPPSNWYVFHRNGMQVSIKYGEELTEKFEKSNQKAFIQLINDPFFSKGVE